MCFEILLFKVFYDPVERPGVSNLISIHSAVTGKSIAEICDDAKHLDTGKYVILEYYNFLF